MPRCVACVNGVRSVGSCSFVASRLLWGVVLDVALTVLCGSLLKAFRSLLLCLKHAVWLARGRVCCCCH